VKLRPIPTYLYLPTYLLGMCIVTKTTLSTDYSVLVSYLPYRTDLPT
jgi:hypothetical protein